MAAMAIRFQCASCDQPIEVDDVWATKAVACPYCHKTVTAPATSTLGDPSDVPVAAPVTGLSSPPGMAPPIAPFTDQQSTTPNRAAVIAIISAACMVVVMGIHISLLRTHAPEIMKAANHETDPMKAMEALRNFLDTQGGVQPAWMSSMAATTFGAGLCWISAGVFGLLGLRKKNRRNLAIAALVAASLGPPILCCGGGFLAGL